MHYIQIEDHFDAAHFLADYKGKCKNIHGHRWKVEVAVASPALIEGGDKRGMVMDFGDLKPLLKEICDYFDHSLIYEKGTLAEDLLALLQREDFALRMVDFRPTAENFAHFIFSQLGERGLKPAWVKVYETPTNLAIYQEDSHVL